MVAEDYFIQKWNDEKKFHPWMREYEGRRLSLHMCVWGDEFKEEWAAEHSASDEAGKRDLDQFFDKCLKAMTNVRSMKMQIGQEKHEKKLSALG